MSRPISVVTVAAPALERDTLATAGAGGVLYHPEHGATLDENARPWSPDVRRFYSRALVGVDLCASSIAAACADDLPPDRP